MSDYLVFPNLYMEEKMSGAFNLKELYRGTILREGYPRNSIFFDQEHGRLLKEVRLPGMSAQRLYADLPRTYR